MISRMYLDYAGNSRNSLAGYEGITFPVFNTYQSGYRQITYMYLMCALHRVYGDVTTKCTNRLGSVQICVMTSILNGALTVYKQVPMNPVGPHLSIMACWYL